MKAFKATELLRKENQSTKRKNKFRKHIIYMSRPLVLCNTRMHVRLNWRFGLLNFYFEINGGAHKAVSTNTESYQFPPMGTSCKAIVQIHYQEYLISSQMNISQPGLE